MYATEIDNYYTNDTVALVTLYSPGQYLVNITASALNCAGSSSALSGVINIIETGTFFKKHEN